ncbi:MAG: MFS transporter [Treponema sp.]|nr:MFS transporter [Treponema sp.]
MAHKKLNVGQKLGFGIFDLGGNMLFTMIGFYCLKYLTDVAGLAAVLAGAAWMIGKAWDAVTDPLMGYISDRTITRMGRRRPYLLFGAIPMMLALWFFFTVPDISSQTMLMLWAMGALMLINTSSTAINVPYSSLTPELTDDYHERSVLNGYRFGCAVIGTIGGAVGVQVLVDAYGGGKHGWSMMSLIMGAVMAFVTLLTFFGTREKRHSWEDIPTEGFFSTYKAVFANRPYVLLALTYGLHLTALNFLQNILVFYVDYIYPAEFVMGLRPFLRIFPFLGNPAGSEAELRGALMILSLMALLVTAMLFIPVSVLVSKKTGKKRTYQICFAIIGLAGLGVSAMGHLLPLEGYLGLLVFAGIGVGFSYVAPFAMVPDTVEFDAVITGERKEGAYYGMWTFISKCGAALSGFISGIILNFGGYAANEVQGPSARLAIRLIIGPLPAFVFLAAFIVLQFYQLDERAYKKMMRQK